MAQEGPKTTQTGTQDGFRRRQTSQERPKTAKEDPKKPPKAPKNPPRGPQEAPRRPQREPVRVPTAYRWLSPHRLLHTVVAAHAARR